MLKPNLLVIVPFVSTPPLHGYEVLCLNHLEKLAEDFSVDVLCAERNGARLAAVGNFDVRIEAFSKNFLNDGFGLLNCIMNSWPLQCYEFASPSFSRHLKRLLSEKKYTRILAYMTRVAPLPQRLSSNSLSLFAIDPLAISYRQLSEHVNFFWRLIYLIEEKRVARFEKKLIDSGVPFGLVSQNDVERYPTILDVGTCDNILHVGYGIGEVENQKQEKAYSEEVVFVISGSGSYLPNHIAAENVLTNIWPKLSTHKNTKLIIVGKGYRPKIHRLASGYDNVELLGFVSDLRRVLREADISLCLSPLDVGVQTKILEAMKEGVIVITNEEGNNGIEAIHGKHLLIGKSSEDVVNLSETLLRDLELRSQLKRAGPAFVEQKFAWDASYKQLMMLLDPEAI